MIRLVSVSARILPSSIALIFLYWKVNIDDIKAQFEDLDYQFYLMDDLNMLCAPSEKLGESLIKVNAKRGFNAC